MSQPQELDQQSLEVEIRRLKENLEPFLIRSHYKEAFEEIVRQHGEIPYSSYKIPRDIFLKEAIGYTNSQIIVDRFVKKSHFRYDYYRDELKQALKQLDFRPEKKIVHLDLGCGPGLFSWVMQDYFMRDYIEEYGMIDSGLKLIGYDHAPNMIKLAHLFRDHLPMEFNLKGYSDVADIISSENFSNCDVIVTLGYVLIQTKGNLNAMNNFSEIVQSLLKPSNSCILIAVDAYRKKEYRESFLKACDQLRKALNKRGVNLVGKPITRSTGEDKGSRMYARLTPK